MLTAPRTDPGVRLSRTGLLPVVRRDRRSGLGRPLQFRSASFRHGTRVVRRCVRTVVRRPLSPRLGPFPPRCPPPLLTGLFQRFDGTMNPSDSSAVLRWLRLSDFPPQPAAACAAVGQPRPPRFRRVPFQRDVFSDHGRASVPRIAGPHMLPSTLVTASASATLFLSRLNSTPHRIAVYASRPPSPATTQHSLAGARYRLPAPVFHRLDRTNFLAHNQKTFTRLASRVDARHSTCIGSRHRR